MNQREFAECVALICSTVGKEMPVEQSRAWFAMLGDLTVEQLKVGIVNALRDYTFAGFPPVGKIREAAGVRSGVLQSQDRATLAWEAVRRAIRQVGGYNSPDFEDKVINACIRGMGGWVAMCDTPEAEMVWREKTFLQNYATLSKCPLPDEQTCRLAGITEKTNGSALPAPVAIVGCLSVGTSGVKNVVVQPSDVKRLPGPNVAAAKLAKSVDCEQTPVKRLPVKSKAEQLAALRSLSEKGKS